MPLDKLITTVAWDTLGMNNRDAWKAIETRLRAESATAPEANALRPAVWAERKRLRAAERAERRGDRP
jgi:hypothetical protein